LFLYQTGRSAANGAACLSSVLSRRSSKSEFGSLEGEGGTPETFIL
jgi:hypothetical protein